MVAYRQTKAVSTHSSIVPPGHEIWFQCVSHVQATPPKSHCKTPAICIKILCSFATRDTTAGFAIKQVFAETWSSKF